MSFLKFLIFSIAIISFSYSQVTYNGFPINLQLYARDKSTNTAQVIITGVVPQSTGYTSIELQVLKGTTNDGGETKTLMYDNNTANFSLTYSLKAELALRTFILNGITGNQKTEIVRADSVVAGDVIVIQGQSNAEARGRQGDADVNQSEFLRVYGSAEENGNYKKQWFLAQGNGDRNSDGNTGQWGMRLARLIMDGQKVPVAVFNGAHGGRPVEFFPRNDADPTDLTTNYGRLLSRLNETNLTEFITTVLWHQGEANARPTHASVGAIDSTTDGYKLVWKSLYEDWESDFTSTDNYFLFQTRFGCGTALTHPEGYWNIQEAHRQLALEMNDVQIISTTGADQFTDNCHYGYDQLTKFAQWAYDLVARDIYDNPPTDNIEPPELLTIAQNGNKLHLVFDNNQGLLGLGDFYTEFRVQGVNSTLTAGQIINNEAILTLSNSNPVTSLTLTSHRGMASPTIINNTTMGIVAFRDFPVVPYKLGCIDSTMQNYDPTATHDNGGCIPMSIFDPERTSGFRFKTTKDHFIINQIDHEKINVSMFNILGRIVFESRDFKSVQIPKINFKKGIYLLKISSISASISKVIIITD